MLPAVAETAGSQLRPDPLSNEPGDDTEGRAIKKHAGVACSTRHT